MEGEAGGINDGSELESEGAPPGFRRVSLLFLWFEKDGDVSEAGIEETETEEIDDDEEEEEEDNEADDDDGFEMIGGGIEAEEGS